MGTSLNIFKTIYRKMSPTAPLETEPGNIHGGEMERLCRPVSDAAWDTAAAEVRIFHIS